MDEKSKEKKGGPKRGLWKPDEDMILKDYVETHGEGNWATLSKRSGLKRGGKSCRLRWKNYLRPNIKRGEMSVEEQDLILRMHNLLGNRWSLIAGRLPCRTDNEVKNYWNTHLNKKTTTTATTTILGKRKSIDFYSNDNQHINANRNDDMIEVQDGNRSTQSASLPTILSPKMTTDDEAGSVDLKEDIITDDTTWMERAVQCFNNYDYIDCYELESPFMMMMHLNSSNLVFDEQPYTPCLDSFLLFETDSDVGTQSFLP